MKDCIKIKKGDVFGRLTVLGDSDSKKHLCICVCGKEIRVFRYNLLSGNTRGCGCIRDKKARERMTTHGKCGTRVYKSWQHAKERCCNPNDKRYKDYGGRGITFCERWERFENFYEDMGDPPKGMSIERIDNDKGYSPENCKWADKIQQGSNKRNNIFIELNGERLTVAEWSKMTGILSATILARFHSGLLPKDILNPNFGKVFFNGSYRRIYDILKEYGVSKTTYHRRIRNGWNFKDAITTKPRTKRTNKKS
jgi:hypothetical protein